MPSTPVRSASPEFFELRIRTARERIPAIAYGTMGAGVALIGGYVYILGEYWIGAAMILGGIVGLFLFGVIGPLSTPFRRNLVTTLDRETNQLWITLSDVPRSIPVGPLDQIERIAMQKREETERMPAIVTFEGYLAGGGTERTKSWRVVVTAKDGSSRTLGPAVELFAARDARRFEAALAQLLAAAEPAPGEKN